MTPREGVFFLCVYFAKHQQKKGLPSLGKGRQKGVYNEKGGTNG